MKVRKQSIKLSTIQLAELDGLTKSKDCTKKELKRVQAILLVNNASSPELIKQLTGYNQKYSFDLRRKYLTQGIASLQDPKKDPRALLTRNQREEVLKMVRITTPKNYGYETPYWTPSILARIIKEQYDVQYKSKTSLYIIFRQAKFTYHKPDKQYKNRQQDIIDTWIEKQRDFIKDALKEEKTEVLVADEMFLSTQTTTQKVWLPQGEFPRIDVSSKREIRTIYGFLNVKRGREHAFKTLRANSDETCKVLDQIGGIYRGKKIVIVWDNAPWHKSALIKSYLDNTKHRFHLIQLPPYAPELNPQENVWKWGRSEVTHNKFIENIDHATNAFVNSLNDQRFDYKFLSLV